MRISTAPLDAYRNFSENDLVGDRSNGQRDGAAGTPPSGATTPSAYEMLLTQKVRADLSEYVEDVKVVTAAKTRECAELRHQHSAYPSRQAIVSSERTKRLDHVDSTVGVDHPGYEQARQQVAAARTIFDARHHLEGGRPLEIYINGFWYGFLLILLALADVPVNFFATTTVLLESDLLALIMTGVFGGLLVFMAHLLGLLLRQGGRRPGQRLRDDGDLTHKFHVGLVGVVSAGLVMAAFMLRAAYIKQPGNAAPDTFVQGSAFFLLLNVGIFCAGLLLSRLRHDPNPEYQKADHDFRVVQSKFEKLQKRYATERRKVEETHAEEMLALGRDQVDLERKIGTLESEIRQIAEQRRQAVNRVINILGQRLTAYQEANARSRPAGQVPSYFGDVGIQSVMQKLFKEFGQ